MRLPRSSGLLLHPTSLPGRFGVGDLGPAAVAFLDMLAEAGQRWWQILPFGPTGHGNSPYQSYSSYAGSRLLISPERLVQDGLLSKKDLADIPAIVEGRADFEAAGAAKDTLLRRAFDNFRPGPAEFPAFVEANASWLDDYALFMALKDAHGGSAWFQWEPGLVTRRPAELARWRKKLAEPIRYYEFVQFLFASQWDALRRSCDARRIGLIGDLPIFVAHDSSDVWARPELFWLDEAGRPLFVAGVPPDYFASTGQLWGNPLYRWEAHAAEGFAWWISRLKATTNRVDLVRLDHFRGFQAYWEIPAGAATAEGGRWALGPGSAFLEAIRDALGGLPLVAEDLGDITKEVEDLRDKFDLPGMRVMQFGFSGDPGTEFHLPFSYPNHCLAYTGTHDNDTTVGWFKGPAGVRAQRDYALRFLGSNGREVHWDVIRAALASVADTVIIPVQDVLGLGRSARMNVPGHPIGNWTWRLRPGQLKPQTVAKLADMTAIYGRWNGTPPPRSGRPSVDGPVAAKPAKSRRKVKST
jgi:4-alpha-glucanotransferase